MLVWLDVETTGLDPNKDELLEVAVVLTSDDLEHLGSWTRVAANVSPGCLDDMAGIVQTMHENSGLLRELQDPGLEHLRMSHTVMDVQLSDWVYQQQGIYKPPLLCGSTIGFDRAFARRFLPRFHDLLHYRSIDVSSVKELARNWCPDAYDAYRKSVQGVKPAHRALPDIHNSIDELKVYRDMIFRPASGIAAVARRMGV